MDTPPCPANETSTMPSINRHRVIRGGSKRIPMSCMTVKLCLHRLVPPYNTGTGNDDLPPIRKTKAPSGVQRVVWWVGCFLLLTGCGHLARTFYHMYDVIDHTDVLVGGGVGHRHLRGEGVNRSRTRYRKYKPSSSTFRAHMYVLVATIALGRTCLYLE